jgi:hypothetical protein
MNLILEWNNILLDAIRAVGKLPLDSPDRERGGPPQVARSIGIVYTAIYDAWSRYDDVANPRHATSIARVSPAKRTEPNRRHQAISTAAYFALINQFPPEIYQTDFRAGYEAKLKAQLDKAGIVLSNLSNDGSMVGERSAKEVLVAREEDGASQKGLYADTGHVNVDCQTIKGHYYKPKNKPMPVLLPASIDFLDYPDRWQALTYLNAEHVAKTPKFICPHWGTVTPFALARGDEFRPQKGPQTFLSQGYLDQAKHVMDIQAKLTPEQKVIAEYWADGPNSELPPGHWTEFAAFVIERDSKPETGGDKAEMDANKKFNLDQSVKLFFALANAVFDASIATWDAKRAFDSVRPISAIRYLFHGKRILGWAGAGKGTQEILGETWKPFQVPSFPTPPFSEFTSGHSGFSMAAATVLKCFTGSDKFGFFYAQETPLKADPTEPVTDILLHWPTFTAAAREAGESRLYGGIHFYEGNVVGLDIGKKVGKKVFEKAEKLWLGK